MTVPNPEFPVAEVDGKVDLIGYATILCIHPVSARRLFKQGRGPQPIVIGSKYYFDRQEAEEFAKTYTGKPGMPRGTKLNGVERMEYGEAASRTLSFNVTEAHFEAIDKLCGPIGDRRPLSAVCRTLIHEALEARGLIE